MSELVVFIILAVPIMLLILLAMNFVIYQMTLNSATEHANISAKLAAYAVGDNTVAYAPRGIRDVKPSEYLSKTLTDAGGFVEKVNSSSCYFPNNDQGNAGAVVRCVANFDVRQLTMPLIPSPFAQGSAVGESITFSGANPNVQ